MKKLFLGLLVVMFMMTMNVAFADVVNTPTGGPVAHNIDVELQVNAGIALMCYDNASGTTDHLVTMGAITQDGQSTGGAAKCNVRTNNNAGYSLAISGVEALVSGSNPADTIPVIAATTPAAWSVPATESGWGYRLDDANSGIAGGATNWGTGTGYGATPLWSGSNQTLGTETAETSSTGSDNLIYFGAEVGTSKIQQTGLYTDTVTFTATTL